MDLFDPNSITALGDARFTLYDIVDLTSVSANHTYMMKACRDEFPDGFNTVLINREIGNKGGTRAVETASLDRYQVIQYCSRWTGETGRVMREKIVAYIKALEARVQAQATSITTLEAQRDAAIEFHDKYMVKLSDDIDTLRDAVYDTQTASVRKKCRDQADSLRGYLSWVRSTTALTHGITAKPRSIDPVAKV